MYLIDCLAVNWKNMITALFLSKLQWKRILCFIALTLFGKILRYRRTDLLYPVSQYAITIYFPYVTSDVLWLNLIYSFIHLCILVWSCGCCYGRLVLLWEICHDWLSFKWKKWKKYTHESNEQWITHGTNYRNCTLTADGMLEWKVALLELHL